MNVSIHEFKNVNIVDMNSISFFQIMFQLRRLIKPSVHQKTDIATLGHLSSENLSPDMMGKYNIEYEGLVNSRQILFFSCLSLIIGN